MASVNSLMEKKLNEKNDSIEHAKPNSFEVNNLVVIENKPAATNKPRFKGS